MEWREKGGEVGWRSYGEDKKERKKDLTDEEENDTLNFVFKRERK